MSTLGGVTIYVESDEPVRESLYTFQNTLDSTADTISFYGAKSQRRTIAFKLIEDVAGAGAGETIEGFVAADANVNYSNNEGSVGNFRIIAFHRKRIPATNKTLPCWDCTADLVAS